MFAPLRGRIIECVCLSAGFFALLSHQRLSIVCPLRGRSVKKYVFLFKEEKELYDKKGNDIGSCGGLCGVGC